jgi:hypothetical protein
MQRLKQHPSAPSVQQEAGCVFLAQADYYQDEKAEPT